MTQMKTHETATPVRAFDRAYINCQFVTPHGTQIVDLVNPTDNEVIGKVTWQTKSTPEKPSVQRKRPSTLFRKVARNTGWSFCSGCTTPWPSEWINSLKRRSWSTAHRKTVRRAPTTSRRTFSCTSRKSSKISTWSKLSAHLRS